MTTDYASIFRSASRGCPLLAFCLIVVALSAGVAAGAESAPFVSPIFGEHMVLQRGRPNLVWGWTEPGREVTVEVGGQTASARAGADGRWLATVEVPPVGGPYRMVISGPQTVAFNDVLVGDVWLCSGQSNMEFRLKDARDGAAAARSAEHSDLRLFTVGRRVAYAPASLPAGEWKRCTEETAAGFSAVAYFFAQVVQREVHVPIGLIQSALGGSPVESWMSAQSLNDIGEFTPQLAEISRLHVSKAPQLGSFLMHWLDEYDAGGADAVWAQPGWDDDGWKAVQVPGGFAELGVPDTPSVCWFRREIELPERLPPGPAKILLGSIEKMDTTYLNGHWVGASSWVENPRAYTVPDGVLKPGRNTVAIRVFKMRPDGGFLAKHRDMRVELADGTGVALAGTWKAAVSVDARPPHPLPLDVENYPTMPVVLSNGMIAPVAPLAIRGALWYQGEANFTRAHQYRKLLSALIADWRARFRQPELPVYIVSLPAFLPRRDEPGNDGWTELREAQAMTVRTVPHTRLAVTVDTGDADNIHPPDKRPVGERLALLALRHTYQRDVVSEGPRFVRAVNEPGVIRLEFANADGGLVAGGLRLGEFSVAGADRVWHWADARIDGNAVVVSSPEVSEPVAARYAWQANPLATLFNAAGLPAEPFRTDDWPLDEGKQRP